MEVKTGIRKTRTIKVKSRSIKTMVMEVTKRRMAIRVAVVTDRLAAERLVARHTSVVALAPFLIGVVAALMIVRLS